MKKIALLEDSIKDEGYIRLLGPIAKKYGYELILFDLSTACLRKSLDKVLLEKPGIIVIDIKYNNSEISQYLRKTATLFYKPYETSLLVDYLASGKEMEFV